MATYTYGGGPDAVLADQAGNVLAGAVLQVWTAQVTGTQITQNLSVPDGSGGWKAATEIVAGADGSFLFRCGSGPTVWLEAAGGKRWRVESWEGGPAGLSTVATASPITGAGTPASPVTVDLSGYAKYPNTQPPSGTDGLSYWISPGKTPDDGGKLNISYSIPTRNASIYAISGRPSPNFHFGPNGVTMRIDDALQEAIGAGKWYDIASFPAYKFATTLAAESCIKFDNPDWDAVSGNIHWGLMLGPLCADKDGKLRWRAYMRQQVDFSDGALIGKGATYVGINSIDALPAGALISGEATFFTGTWGVLS